MKVLIFGATGLAGGSVLKACLDAPLIEEVRAITRRPVGFPHSKLHEFIHDDFLNYLAVSDAFAGVDACLFCLGVSVMQVSGEAEYRRITHDLAMAAARQLKNISPMVTFHYRNPGDVQEISNIALLTHLQYDFADMSGRFHHFMGFPGFGQREDGGDQHA